jgi:ParB family chromosome partitioning protein
MALEEHTTATEDTLAESLITSQDDMSTSRIMECDSTFLDTVEIEPKFRDLLRPLTPDEFEKLERNIIGDGYVRDPLVVWRSKNKLVEGHHRAKIIRKYGMQFPLVYKEFESDADAAKWIIDNQDGQREQSDMDRIITARKFEDMVREDAKRRHDANGGDHGNQYTGGKVAAVENFPPPPDTSKSRDELGRMAGVSGRTYDHGIYALEHAPEPVIQAARDKELSVNAAYEIAQMTEEQQNEIVRRIEKGEDSPKKVYVEMRRELREAENGDVADEERQQTAEPTYHVTVPYEPEPEDTSEYYYGYTTQGMPTYEASPQPTTYTAQDAPTVAQPEPAKKAHVSYNSGQNEWYTPEVYITAARKVMGDIDLDPASSEIANRTVKAEIYYTQETDGLAHDWFGNIWMNPPYSSDKIGRFADKLADEYENYESAIVLVNNATETSWFSTMVSCASAVCFPRGRVKFLDPEGNPGAPLQGQAIIYIGEQPDMFCDVFSEFGWVATLV